MNIFQLSFDDRLQSWYKLRTELSTENLETKCVETDRWWQCAPIVNNHLHYAEVSQWPDPWTLLDENTYCPIARGLGMVYTLALLGIKDIDFSLASCYNDDCTIVLVDKYILNYYPNSVLTSSLSEFTITKTIDIAPLLKQLK
jgi:hypothetical protein